MITQIGSLPFNNIQKAIDYSLKHNIPFLPELPKLNDSMLSYIKKPGKLSCLEDFAKNKFNIVKIQSIGPATLMLSNYNEDEAMQSIYTHINTIINKLKAKEIILFLDEQSLGHAGFNFIALWSAIFSCFNVKKGVHVCSSMDWDKLFQADLDYISFDASKYDITLYPKYRSNKNIAWGIENLVNVKDYQENDLITPPCGLGKKNEQSCSH